MAELLLAPSSAGAGTEIGLEEQRMLAEFYAEPRVENYAEVPPAEAFDFTAICDALGVKPGEWRYLVVFSSQRKPESSDLLMAAADANAHEEAEHHPVGGLEIYKRLQDRSFCIWESQWQARTATRGPSHGAASSLTADMYSSYTVDTFWVYNPGEGEEVELFRQSELDDDQLAAVAEINRQAQEAGEQRIAEAGGLAGALVTRYMLVEAA
jgi:hypothetical protein